MYEKEKKQPQANKNFTFRGDRSNEPIQLQAKLCCNSLSRYHIAKEGE